MRANTAGVCRRARRAAEKKKAVCCKHAVKAPFGGITRDVKAWIGGMNESESRLSIHVRHDRL